MMINEKTPQISPDSCRACCDSFNSDKKNKHNLLQCRPGGSSSREKSDYTQALEAITGVQVTPSDGFQKAVCTRCRSMLSKYHKNVYEIGRITAFIRERAVGLLDTRTSPCITSPMRVTRDAACQTDSSSVLRIQTNLSPSRRSKALQVQIRVPNHSVYCSTDDQEVVCTKPAKRRRHYDTDPPDGFPPRLPLPDDVTDWHADSQSLWSGSGLRITDSPSSQADAWVKVTVKDEDEEEDIPWSGRRQEEDEEQVDRKPPVSSPSPCPGSLAPVETSVKEAETKTPP